MNLEEFVLPDSAISVVVALAKRAFAGEGFELHLKHWTSEVVLLRGALKFKKLFASFNSGGATLETRIAKDKNGALLKETIVQSSINHKLVSKALELHRDRDSQGLAEAETYDTEFVSLSSQITPCPEELLDAIKFKTAQFDQTFAEHHNKSMTAFKGFFKAGTEESWKSKLGGDSSWEIVKKTAFETLSKLSGNEITSNIASLEQARGGNKNYILRVFPTVGHIL